VIPQLRSPVELGAALAVDKSGGWVFAVSLWNERGLIGVLMLGEKQSEGLYTQEEIEIARAVGEHLIDTRASIEMARRLISLQRQRLIQSQILDQQTRRVLHDEVLPFVHTSILNLDGKENQQSEHIPELISQLEEIHRQLSNLLSSTSSTLAVEVRQLGFMGAVRKTIEVELRGSFDDVFWEIQPQGEQELTRIPTLIAEVLFFAVREAVRNAARHGRQTGSGTRFCLSVGLKAQNGLVITIEDNGAGFAIGEPLPINGGSGQGLALHSTMMAVIGGLLTVESAPGQYTRVTIELPEMAWQNWE
jgi:two-component sensor histidine kinase